ncbi:MAG: hypothetical protein M1836_007751 [Candelina mexicana]|nr:MAG: hypothetical protein M1836_007751 [Candelina mexicana]
MSHRAKPAQTGSSRSLRNRLRSFLHRQKLPTDLTKLSYSSSVNVDCRFLRLPAELRLHIYGYVFGEDQLFHLVNVRDGHQRSRRRSKSITARFAHIRCRSPSSIGNCASTPIWCHEICSPFHNRCTCTNGASTYFVEDDIAVSSSDYAFPGVSNGNLALLRTCRQIYTETCSYTYSHNIFELKDIRHLQLFIASIPMTQAHAIQKLELNWAMQYGFSYGLPTYDVCPPLRGYAWWEEFWGVIATQLNLRELSICMGDSFFGGSPRRELVGLDYQARWVQPMLRVRGLRKFWFFLRISNDYVVYMSEERRKGVEVFINALKERMVGGKVEFD